MFKLRKSWAAIATSVAVLGLLLTAAAPQAAADSIDTQSFTVQNGAILPTSSTGYGTITIDVNAAGTSATITVTMASGYYLDKFGYNVGSSGSISSTVVNCGANQTAVFNVNNNPNPLTCGGITPGGTEKFDGFGSFNSTISGGTGGSSGFTTLVFTVTGTGLTLGTFENLSTIPPGDQRAWFGGETGYIGNSCTGWVAGGGNANLQDGTSTPSTDCSSSTVPEPGSLTLLGTGLLTLAGFARRRMSRS